MELRRKKRCAYVLAGAHRRLFLLSRSLSAWRLLPDLARLARRRSQAVSAVYTRRGSPFTALIIKYYEINLDRHIFTMFE